MLIRTLSELERALGSGALDRYVVRRREEGVLEVACGRGAVMFAEPSRWTDRERLRGLLAEARARAASLLLLGEESDFDRAVDTLGPEAARDDLALVGLPLGPARLLLDLRHFEEVTNARAASESGSREIQRYTYELHEINAIARAMASERDIERLLGLILEKSRYITGADAGSVYVVEDDAAAPLPAPGGGSEGGAVVGGDSGRGAVPAMLARRLRFRVTQNESHAVDLKEFSIPVDDRTIVGQAVLRKQSIRIPDMYQLDDPAQNPWGYRHDRSIDEKTGYQTRSMLTVPMIDARGDVIGVIQLINKKRDPRERLTAPADFDAKVVPFDERAEELAVILASQAGVALENAILYAEIRQLFEGFVHASVTAIESRDPTTSGHSQRVARLTVGLAERVDGLGDGPFAGVRFDRDALKQIEYAGLLHDFGKVGVREKVLVKAKKLYESDRDVVLARFAYVRERAQADAQRRKLEALAEGSAGDPRVAERLAEIEAALQAQIAALDADLAFILQANEPTVLEEGGFEHLSDIAARTYRDPDGMVRPLLTPPEVEALSVPRGSLTHGERHEIESHVVHTYNFLRRIPWGRSLREIPRIAAAHHEKLDGSGYPRRLRAEQIPLPAKMMTISDIFDALTASDRPYKKAMPVERALDIIRAEVGQGKIDADLFQLFVGAKVYSLVL